MLISADAYVYVTYNKIIALYKKFKIWNSKYELLILVNVL